MNLLDECTAARQSAGIVNLGTRGRIVVRGDDRKTFLHALLTNDVALLGPGTGCYAALLTPQGRIVADMNVFELGDVMLVDVRREVKDTLLQRLDQLIFSEDVQLGDVSEAWGCLGAYGPLALSIAGGAIGADFATFRPFQNARVDHRGELVVAARSDGLGLPGMLLFTAAARIPALAQALGNAGATPLSDAAAEALRVEAGEPAFLAELTDDVIPLEAGIEARAVSFLKGCFPGQEVLVRIRDRGQGRVARRLVGLLVDGDVVPAAGSRIMSAGKDIGHVTSAVMSPALARPIAMGYLHRDFIALGTAVTIVHGDAPLVATVTELPFVR
jgi:tRNA-modifying protein YgfZ